MVRKIIGTVLIIISFFLVIVFIHNGLLFPHLSGPVVLGIIGILLLALRKKEKA